MPPADSIGSVPQLARALLVAGSRCALALVLLATAACRPTESIGEPKRVLPTVRIGSTNFSEQLILAELYGRALESRGYPVERHLNLGSRETVAPALESGKIDLYAEYLATMLAFITRGSDRGSPDPAATHARLAEALAARGIAVLNYAPAANTNGFAVTRATAERYRLSSLSDLVPVAGQLTFGGPPECPVRPFCLPGLRQTYGVTFQRFRILDTGGPQTVAALESGEVDVGLLFTTDPAVRARQLVLLADDRSLQLADNVAPVVRSDLVKRAPTDFRSTLDELSARLTSTELTELNGRVQLDNRSPADTAADWLRAKGFVR